MESRSSAIVSSTGLVAWRYLVAVLAVVATAALSLACKTAWGDWLPATSFLAAIAVAGLLGGGGPALLATVLSAAAFAYFLSPVGSFAVAHPRDQIQLLLVVGTGLLVGAAARRAERGRARVEAERKGLETRFRTVFATDAPFAIGSAGGAVDEANDAWLRLFGCTRAELAAGKLLWTDLIPAHARDVLRAGSPLPPAKLSHTRPDGEQVTVLLGGTPLPGEPDRLVLFAYDMTDRVRIERELDASQARMQRLWDSNIIGVAYGYADGAVTDANDSVLRMMGVSREEMRAGRARWTDVTPAEYLPLDERGVAEALEHGACTPYEKVYRSREGHIVPILIGYALVDRAKSELVAFMIDLTEQKRAETALAQQVTKAITDGVSTALFLVDEDGRCAFMNPAAEAMTGWKQPELCRMRMHDALHHHHLDGSPYPADDCVLQRTYKAGGRLSNYEDFFFRKDGSSFPIVCTATPLERPGAPRRTVFEVQDVTEQRRGAVEREMLLESERSARAQAERANRVKDEFVSTVSHELRTPLNAVLGWTSLARRPGQGPEKVSRALTIVERNARALGQIIDDLLDVGRIASGKLNVDLAPADVRTVVAAAVEAERPAAEAKGLTLVASNGNGPATVLGDAKRLQQVVFNLLTNAVKFTPSGGRIEVALAPVDGSIELSVRDTGEGIDPAFVPHLFERFHQADAALSRGHGGLGLGLAIVRHIVELHGGTVRAESEGRGRGSCFKVMLPLVRAREDRRAPHPFPHAPLAGLAGARVLVVEDEPDAAGLLKRLFEEQGARVVAASSGFAALDAIAAEPIDVIVSDIGMPGMDGYELLRRVRAGGRARDVPALAVTAYARPEDRARALDAGYQAHLPKPLDPSAMLSTVASLVTPHAA